MAAPLGAPPTPTLDPVAQQWVAPTQASEVSALTGAGRVTPVSVPTHGESAPKVEGGASVSEDDDPHAAAVATRASDRTTPIRMGVRPTGRVTVVGGLSEL